MSQTKVTTKKTQDNKTHVIIKNAQPTLPALMKYLATFKLDQAAKVVKGMKRDLDDAEKILRTMRETQKNTQN